MLARMVTPGNRVADVGCDHGFLSIYLVQNGISPRALAMDVRTGPLEAAKGHVAACGLGSYIEVRLSDGLSACGAGEADAVVCAGMGGRLMERILTEGMDRARQMRELILQPQSEIPQFRAFLREAGFGIVQEDAIREDGKYYFAMKARPGAGDSGQMPAGRGGERDAAGGGAEDAGTRELYDLFGEHLLKRRHPVLFAYLRQRRSYLGRLGADLEAAGSARADGRLEEVRRELTAVLDSYFDSGKEAPKEP